MMVGIMMLAAQETVMLFILSLVCTVGILAAHNHIGRRLEALAEEE